MHSSFSTMLLMPLPKTRKSILRMCLNGLFFQTGTGKHFQERKFVVSSPAFQADTEKCALDHYSVSAGKPEPRAGRLRKRLGLMFRWERARWGCAQFHYLFGANSLGR